MIVLVIGDHPDCPGDVGAVPAYVRSARICSLARCSVTRLWAR
jgi:hypothetical protein